MLARKLYLVFGVEVESLVTATLVSGRHPFEVTKIFDLGLGTFSVRDKRAEEDH